ARVQRPRMPHAPHPQQAPHPINDVVRRHARWLEHVEQSIQLAGAFAAQALGAHEPPASSAPAPTAAGSSGGSHWLTAATMRSKASATGALTVHPAAPGWPPPPKAEATTLTSTRPRERRLTR